ncbi:uncharacterized protein LAESUDRAFT_815489 [Laetiporus sulphureus 93-53]|uniref:Transmembrane protein n=1 Tax=Laetiporus sulphureus 93-53 TaxID=1314785 RepID=A0A165C4F6_9APHY|nr:uncharacterized protein LAESUDRAFT_815489 [Laetiporus sulphureus 93-53]KZT02187.1 hypothetical protein LAESUDRAFT_815489 [Laetiporus sulphureus 93-53]
MSFQTMVEEALRRCHQVPGTRMVQISETKRDVEDERRVCGEEQQLNGHLEPPPREAVVAAAASQPMPGSHNKVKNAPLFLLAAILWCLCIYGAFSTMKPANVTTQDLVPVSAPAHIPFQDTQKKQMEAFLQQVEEEMRAINATRDAVDAARHAIDKERETIDKQHDMIDKEREAVDKEREAIDKQREAAAVARVPHLLHWVKDSHPFLQGLLMLLATPFIIVGNMLWGAGLLIEGIGRLLVLGPRAAYRWLSGV